MLTSAYPSCPPLRVVLALGLCACAKPFPPPAAPSPPPEPAAEPAPRRYDTIERAAFNKQAQRLNLPMFWTADANENGSVDPDEVVPLLFFASSPAWTTDNEFTPEFDTAYDALVAAHRAPDPEGDDDEARRRRAVLRELDLGRPTLVRSDLRSLPDNERRAIARLLEAAALIDRLYAIQTGAAVLASGVPDDPASQSLFRRNWGPRCMAPQTEPDPDCSAIPGAPKPRVDVYPADLQDDAGFCAALEKRPDAKELLAPFVVVREKDGKLVTEKYSQAYEGPMQSIAARLDAAAEELGTDEEPFKDYLRAAASAFRDNDWEAADEAWSKMTGKNSKYYLRIGPDEVYWEPCSQKAGFHVSFARVNRDSLAWQERLLPLQQKMEQSLARLIGRPYRARQITFHLPDFIDVIVNAGNSRSALGGTIGQSLPNWGKVAEESRGRTVVMANLFRDPDSLEDSRQVVASLFDAEAAAMRTDDATPGLLVTILHEAAHNLGPSQGYEYRGKPSKLAFGGELATMLEELKAHTGALYYLDMLAKQGVIDAEMQQRAYLDSVRWAFGQISRGMRTKSGRRKPYGQLSAIQIGFLMDEGAVEWDPEAVAANGKDTGAFKIRLDGFPAACQKMMKQVGRIKATHDRAACEALAAKYVDGDVVPLETISKRVQRQPRPALLYALDL